VQMTAESYGIDTRGLDKAATLKAIENFLHAEARAGRRCLLIVDEAQNLSVDALEELRMLSNFQLGSSALLQIFLLGQPEFRDLLQGSAELEQLRQRVIATHHLDPMEANEVEPYIIHRLSRAGWNGRPHISSEAFAALYAQTEGVPRKLNTLMNRVLLMGAVEQVDEIDADLVRAVIADMAGKPFEYEAPMSARGDVSLAMPVVAEPEPAAAVAPEAVLPSEDLVVDQEPVIDEEPEAEPEEFLLEEIAPQAPVFEPVPLAAVVTEKVEMPNTQYLDALANRVSALEKHVSDQDEALRRVLAMMIDWMDKESDVQARYSQSSRAA
jgi:general secretion pathway protein A